MNVYGGYIYAERGGERVTVAVSLIAPNEDVAFAAIAARGEKEFPPGEGWAKHTGGLSPLNAAATAMYRDWLASVSAN